MKNAITMFIVVLMFAGTAQSGHPTVFNTQWISSKPEVMTYRSTGKQGDGLFQVSIMRSDSTIEVYINIITPGFTKTVGGKMTFDMRPLESTGKIIVDNGVVMDTKCHYDIDWLSIKTVIAPYNQTVEDSLGFTHPIIDFSQIPMVVRTLQINDSAQYSFESLNPNTNQIIPMTIKTIGEGHIIDVDCYKVEMNTFEGRAVYWVEKDSRHRVMRIEEPDRNRISELIQ